MMRTLSNLNQDEQDRLFYICLQRIRSKDISDLLAMLYLGDVTTDQIKNACKGFKHPRHAVRALKVNGVMISFRSGNYSLVGIDDGEVSGMVIKESYK